MPQVFFSGQLDSCDSFHFIGRRKLLLVSFCSFTYLCSGYGEIRRVWEEQTILQGQEVRKHDRLQGRQQGL
jgi:hypothetical protein